MSYRKGHDLLDSQHGAYNSRRGGEDLSRRKSNMKPLLEKKTYTSSEHEDQVDDAEPIANGLDHQAPGGSVSYAQTSRKPLIDYCTNEWMEKPSLPDYQDGSDVDSEDDAEEWYDYCLDRIRSRKTRRWALFITLLLAVSLYLYSTIRPRIVEERILIEALRLRDEAQTRKPFGGVFGNNVRPSFSDMIHLKTLDQRYLPGKNATKESGRLLFVGDIHGCKEELQALLKKAQFDPNEDHLVTTGDMIAKGPDSLGTVDLLRGIGASCVRGNHEDRILLLAQARSSRHLRHHSGGNARDEAALEKPSNPLPSWPDDSLGLELNADHIEYLQSCPVILKVGHIDALQGNVVVVHAGLVPGVPLKDQDPGSVMTMRTIDLHTHVPSKDGKEGPIKEANDKLLVKTPKGRWPDKKPPHNVHWAKLWNQFQNMLPEFKKWQGKEGMVVVYGHDSKKGLQLKKWSKGLDSGCVRGGKLTALIVSKGGKGQEIVSVECKDYRS
jgi:hypothetical protein